MKIPMKSAIGFDAFASAAGPSRLAGSNSPVVADAAGAAVLVAPEESFRVNAATAQTIGAAAGSSPLPDPSQPSIAAPARREPAGDSSVARAGPAVAGPAVTTDCPTVAAGFATVPSQAKSVAPPTSSAAATTSIEGRPGVDRSLSNGPAADS